MNIKAAIKAILTIILLSLLIIGFVIGISFINKNFAPSEATTIITSIAFGIPLILSVFIYFYEIFNSTNNNNKIFK